MTNASAKRDILQALQAGPKFPLVGSLPSPGSRRGLRLLQWLDRSGLALSFFASVQANETGGRLPSVWHEALHQRMQRNAARFHDMLEEFRRLNEAFRARDIRVVTLKGFSLNPDFCENPILRHQTDFDFLVDSADIDAAAEVLHSFGYRTPRLSHSEESSFTTPLIHVPSHEDDLYALQHHRQVDLHVSPTETSAWLKPEFSADCLRHAVSMTLCGVNFHALALPDRFLAQVLHVFRHTSRSWVRLSWLLEISRFMELHREDETLWRRVIERAGAGLQTSRAFALILSLTRRLFRCRIPSQMGAWAARGMTPSLRTWLDRFSLNWALSDWPGSLSNVFLAPDFIPDGRRRWEYLASRLLPNKSQTMIETMASARKKKSVGWHLRRAHFVLHRSTAHLQNICSLPLLQLRWRHAISASRPGLWKLET